MSKPSKPTPQLYSCLFPELQIIAKCMGYNLLVHGSMCRDLDLVAIPWTDDPRSHLELLTAFCVCLGVTPGIKNEDYLHSKLPGGRYSYVINLNRCGKYNGHVDQQIYLDISITPLVKNA